MTVRRAAAGGRLVVGLVRGVHGLRGAVRVEVLSDVADRFAVGRRLYREGDDVPLTIIWVHPDERGLLVRFGEVTDRDRAERLRNVYLETVREPGEHLPRGRYYWHEVIGARVRSVEGETLGVVVDIFRAGGGEVALVRGPRGEFNVPLVRAVMRRFAPRRGDIVVDTTALGLAEGRRRSKLVEAPPPTKGVP